MRECWNVITRTSVGMLSHACVGMLSHARELECYHMRECWNVITCASVGMLSHARVLECYHMRECCNVIICVSVGMLSHARVLAWHKSFHEGWETMEHDVRSGRLSTMSTPENIQRVWDLLPQNRQITVRMLSEELNTGKISCHDILCKDTGKRKLNARLIPYSLTQQKKEDSSSICVNLLKLQARITHSALPPLLELWATGKWFLPHDNSQPRMALSISFSQ
jgi:hypothetical protein